MADPNDSDYHGNVEQPEGDASFAASAGSVIEAVLNERDPMNAEHFREWKRKGICGSVGDNQHWIRMLVEMECRLSPNDQAEACCGSLADYIKRQEEWSSKTFGHGVRTKGITAHIRKELDEIEAAPHDVEEWVDVVILALDGAWRAGYSPEQICAALDAKQAKNFLRTYPMPISDDHPSEHVREARGVLELARDAVDNILRNGRLCPNDTDGDGDCGRPMCPVCGRERHNAKGDSSAVAD